MTAQTERSVREERKITYLNCQRIAFVVEAFVHHIIAGGTLQQDSGKVLEKGVRDAARMVSSDGADGVSATLSDSIPFRGPGFRKLISRGERRTAAR